MNGNICKINEDIFMMAYYFNLEKDICEALLKRKDFKKTINIDMNTVD
jgi:hypothetical protein